MPDIGKPNRPIDSEEMPANTFGKEVVLLTQGGHNPAEVIGTNPNKRSRLEIVGDIKEYLRNV